MGDLKELMGDLKELMGDLKELKGYERSELIGLGRA